MTNLNKTTRPSKPGDRPSMPTLAEVYAELSGKPMTLRFIEMADVFNPDLDATGLHTIATFTARVKKGERPLCLTCNFEWSNLRCDPPAAVALLTTHEFFCDGDRPALVSGICRTCFETLNLIARSHAVYRKALWPDLRSVHEPSPLAQ